MEHVPFYETKMYALAVGYQKFLAENAFEEVGVAEVIRALEEKLLAEIISDYIHPDNPAIATLEWVANRLKYQILKMNSLNGSDPAWKQENLIRGVLETYFLDTCRSTEALVCRL